MKTFPDRKKNRTCQEQKHTKRNTKGGSLGRRLVLIQDGNTKLYERMKARRMGIDMHTLK